MFSLRSVIFLSCLISFPSHSPVNANKRISENGADHQTPSNQKKRGKISSMDKTITYFDRLKRVD